MGGGIFKQRKGKENWIKKLTWLFVTAVPNCAENVTIAF
jgi:hypothetical protein